MLSLLLLSACCLLGGPDCEALHAQGGLRLVLDVAPGGDADQVVPVLQQRLEAVDQRCAKVYTQGSQVVVDVPAPPPELDVRAILTKPGVLALRPALPQEQAQELAMAIYEAEPEESGLHIYEGRLSGDEARLRAWAEAGSPLLPEGVLALVDPAWGMQPAQLYLVRHQGMVAPVLLDVDVVQTDWGEPQVNGRFGEEDGERFAELTGRMVKEILVITVDDEVLSAPIVQERIPGHRFAISMGTSSGDPLVEAQELAVLLRSGSLPAPVELVSETLYVPDE